MLSRKRNQTLAISLRQYIPNMCSEILDIGCANGELLNSLAELGFLNLSGVEPSAASLAMIANPERFKLYKGYIGELDRQKKYDIITISHVLEHVENIQGVLADIHLRLNADGILYVEVPDAKRYEKYYVSPYHYFDTEHINHFYEEILEKTLQMNGFQVFAKGEKIIPIHTGVDYPAIYMFAKKKEEKVIDASANSPLEWIMRYVDRSKEEYNQLGLEIIVDNEEPIIIFGCGSSTMRLLGNTALRKKNIAAFSDNNSTYWGMTLIGRPIIPPSMLSQKKERILIASKMYGAEIAENLSRMLGIDSKRLLRL